MAQTQRGEAGGVRTGTSAAALSPRALTLDDLRQRRGEILRIATSHGAHNVRVFGSVADGRARPDSDVDFIVDFDPDRTVLDLSGLILDLEDALGRKVDVIEHPGQSPAGERIRRDAVPL